MSLPEVSGLVSAKELVQTAASIAEWQLDDGPHKGMIPWFPGGHADVWNHVEAAMALDTMGMHDPAADAYQWLVNTQRPDGAWHQYYTADGIEQDKLDANCVAYVATGAWHRYLVTGDQSFLEDIWPTVQRAIDFVLDLQEPRGEIRWARHADGTPWSFALLTGSASMVHSLRCAIAIAELLDHERPDWELGAARLAHAVRHIPEAFAPKDRWAMDWYYPVLAGVLDQAAGKSRLDERYETFVIEGRGIRCVSDRPWVTAAETSECVLALLGIGERERAEELFGWIQALRQDDGRYLTGMVYPQEVSFPEDERATYSAAAVVLTADALSGTSAASPLFADHTFLPELIAIDDTDAA